MIAIKKYYKRTLDNARQKVVAFDMLVDNHLSSRLEQWIQMSQYFLRLRHRAQNLYGQQGVDAFLFDSVFSQLFGVLDRAGNNLVNVIEFGALDTSPQGIVQIHIRLDAINLCNL